MKISVSDYEDYLYDHYKEHGIDTSLVNVKPLA